MADIDRRGDKFSTRNMKFAHNPMCLLLFLAGLLSLPAGAFSETATVTAGTLNVRGRPGFVGEVFTNLKQGDKVNVLERTTVPATQAGEPADWLKISMPANTPVWVFGAFIDPDSNVVEADTLNVRAGPGENYSIVGRVNAGDVVTPINRRDGWIEIEAPEGCYAYISANHVEMASPAPVETAPATPAEAGDSEVELATQPLESEPETVITDTEPEVFERPEPAPTEVAVAEPAEEDVIRPVALEEPTVTSASRNAPLPSPADPQPERDIIDSPAEAAQRVLEERYRQSQTWDISNDPNDQLLKEFPEYRREVTRDGIVELAGSIQAPSNYVLKNAATGYRINFLYTTSDNIPFRDLLGLKVRVTGEEAMDPRWDKTPVLLIKRLKVLP